MEDSIVLDPMAHLISAAPDQISSDLAGEAVILNLKSGIYYGLNEVGARVWKLLQTPQSFSAIKAVILSEYDVDAETCDRDLLAILKDLKDAALIEVTDAVAS